jgi:predicted porin
MAALGSVRHKTQGLLALGLLTASVVAQAQSSVTVYGVMDLALMRTDFARSGAGSLNEELSGLRNGSRLGFRGVEDLGDGLQARFQLEQGINADAGTLGQGGRGFGRQSYVALQGAFGTFAFGRMGTVGSGTGAFEIVSDFDPFQMGFGAAGIGSTMSESVGLRTDNAILYRTPKFGGFQATWLHSLQANGAEGVSSTNTRVDSIGAAFQSGPLQAAATYLVAKFPDANAFKDEKLLQLGLAYDLKVVKLHAMFANETGVRSALISATGGVAAGADATAWMLGISAPIGQHKVLASYQVRNGKQQTVGTTAFDADRKVLGLGYEYWLSKRTNLNAVIAKTSGSGSLAVGAAGTDFANLRQVAVGETHRF